MAHQATSAPPRAGTRVRARIGAEVARARRSESLAVAWRAFAWSRAAIFALAAYAALTMGGGGLGARNAAKFDVPLLTHPFGGFGDIVLSPLARWDAVWYLAISYDGYGPAGSPRAAFFPLYPLLARGAGELGGGSRGAVLIGAYAVTLAAFLAALVMLHQLARLELGRSAAGAAVLMISVFPGSLYFGAPYSESLFLATSVGAFLAARSGRWAWAGVAAAGASATRSAGLLLLLPLLILYLYGPRSDRPHEPPRADAGWLASLRPIHRVRGDLAWLALAPLGLVVYAAWLAGAHGDALAFSNVQDFWNRSFSGPLVGVLDGARAAFDGARQLLSGQREVVYFDRAAGDPLRSGAQNLMLFGFLAWGLWAAVGVLRRLPFAYGAYVVAALALPLSYPVGPQPLMSIPRFLAVLFPLFIWLGLVCTERRSTVRVAAGSAVGLGLFVTEFASWHWVA